MRRGLLLGVLAVVLATAGCGGDDDDSDGSASTVSKAEFIQRADELCRDFRRKRDDLEAEADATSDTDRQAQIFRQLADEADATGDKFERLPVPAGDKAIIDRYISASRDQIDVVRRIADALDDRDPGAVATLLGSGERSGDEVQDIAQDYGFKVCGSEGQ